MDKTKPVKKIKVGAVCATIWENQSKEGRTFPSIHVDRVYKDSAGEWKATGTFRRNDLPNAMLALGEALRYLSFGEDAAKV